MSNRKLSARAREAARDAAVAKLQSLHSGRLPNSAAIEIADAALDAAYPLIIERFADLEEDAAVLNALRAYGVDNWSGYSDALASLH
jgi:hypothetical protein